MDDASNGLLSKINNDTTQPSRFNWETTPLGNPSAWPGYLRAAVEAYTGNQPNTFSTAQPQITNKNIEEAELRLRLANEAAQLGTFDWDLANNTFFQSPRVSEIFGFVGTPGITHDKLVSAFHPEDKPIRDKAVAESYEKGILVYEARIIWPDKTLHWVKVYGKVVFDEHRIPLRMFGTVQDITSEKNVLKQLEAEEERARLAIESAQLGTFDWKSGSDIITHSARFSEIFGVAPGEPIYRGVMAKRIHPDDAQIRIKALENSHDKGSIYYEVRIVWPDNSIHWVKVFGKITYDTQKQPQRIFGIVQDVTKEKESVALLAENEDRLRIAVDSAELGTWDLHLNPSTIFHSPRLSTIFGYADDTVLTAEELKKRIHPEDVQRVIDAHLKALTSRELKYEVRIVWGDGSIHWILCCGKTIYDDKQQPIRMLGIVMDITDRKNMEVTLENEVLQRTGELIRSEERHHKMVEEIQDYAIILLSKEGIIQNWNQGAEKIKGYKEEEIIGKSFMSFYTAKDQESQVPHKLIEEATNKGKATTEGWRVRKDGSLFWASVVITALHDENDNLIGFTKITRDLTERKKTEEQRRLQNEELRKKNSELQQQKEFVDIILDSSVDIISVFDTEMRYVVVNKTFEEIYKVKRQDILGKTINEVFSPEKTAGFRANMQKALNGESMQGILHVSPITGRHYESFFIPLKNNNEVYAVLAVAHDNTDILESAKKLEIANAFLEQKTRDLQKANIELEKTNSELEQYAYVASHDLQEPLRKIRIYSGILHETLKTDTNSAALPTLQKVIDSAARMSNLIYDLLNFSRLLNPEKHFTSTDLNKTFENIISDFELVIEQKNASIQLGEMPVIDAVPLQMNQLFYNLINNALKFSAPGRQPVIKVQARAVKHTIDNHAALREGIQYVEITVEDNGIGFSPQYAEQIFEVFKRLHTKQSYQGSGIGLALCRRIALNHQGDIFAESKENNGSVFHVILPVHQP